MLVQTPSTSLALMPNGVQPVQWRVSHGLTGYQTAVEHMEATAHAIHNNTMAEQIWLVEHSPVYTAGTSATPEDLVAANRFPVFRTGRGGKYTYHGPGQRVVYVMLDLSRRRRDVRAFVSALEAWIMDALALFDVRGETRPGRTGVWVNRPGLGREDKIAAIGVRIRRWVSFHGFSLNVAPDLEHYTGIVPCGIAGHGVTSLSALGLPVAMDDVDEALRLTFPAFFGALNVVPE